MTTLAQKSAANAMPAPGVGVAQFKRRHQDRRDSVDFACSALRMRRCGAAEASKRVSSRRSSVWTNDCAESSRWQAAQPDTCASRREPCDALNSPSTYPESWILASLQFMVSLAQAFEGVQHQPARAREARHDGSDRDFQGRCDFLVRKIFQLAKDKGLAVLDRQRLECLVEQPDVVVA